MELRQILAALLITFNVWGFSQNSAQELLSATANNEKELYLKLISQNKALQQSLENLTSTLQKKVAERGNIPKEYQTVLLLEQGGSELNTFRRFYEEILGGAKISNLPSKALVEIENTQNVIMQYGGPAKQSLKQLNKIDSTLTPRYMTWKKQALGVSTTYTNALLNFAVAENYFLSAFLNKALNFDQSLGKVDFKFDHISPVVLAKDNVMKEGEEFSAQITLAAYSDKIKPIILINGQRIEGNTYSLTTSTQGALKITDNLWKQTIEATIQIPSPLNPTQMVEMKTTHEYFIVK